MREILAHQDGNDQSTSGDPHAKFIGVLDVPEHLVTGLNLPEGTNVVCFYLRDKGEFVVGLSATGHTEEEARSRISQIPDVCGFGKTDNDAYGMFQAKAELLIKAANPKYMN